MACALVDIFVTFVFVTLQKIVDIFVCIAMYTIPLSYFLLLVRRKNLICSSSFQMKSRYVGSVVSLST